jgi:hypothetical protein
MKKLSVILLLLILFLNGYGQPDGKPYAGRDLTVKSGSVRYVEALDLPVFEFSVEGMAGKTAPEPDGKMDGAPVLGYVFPTTLNSADAGFSKTESTLPWPSGLPRFDDSPLWD